MPFYLRLRVSKSVKAHTEGGICLCKYCRSLRRVRTTCDSLTRVPVSVLKRYNFCLWSFKYRQFFDLNATGSQRAQPCLPRDKTIMETALFVWFKLLDIRDEKILVFALGSIRVCDVTEIFLTLRNCAVAVEKNIIKEFKKKQSQWWQRDETRTPTALATFKTKID